MLVLRILRSVYCWKELRQPERLALQRWSLCFAWVLFAPVFELCAAISRISYCSRIWDCWPEKRPAGRLICFFNCITWPIVIVTHGEKRPSKDANTTAGSCFPLAAGGRTFILYHYSFNKTALQTTVVLISIPVPTGSRWLKIQDCGFASEFKNTELETWSRAINRDQLGCEREARRRKVTASSYWAVWWPFPGDPNTDWALRVPRGSAPSPGPDWQL